MHSHCSSEPFQIAARNVLVDAALTCKISDFGMSAAVCGGDSDYASNYIKLHGELSVRWSSIEVLQEGKYSRASDVWAFGILVYEIMSRGKLPYAEFPMLTEATAQIREGAKLPCPEECSVTVYDEIMYPCWNADPSQRPGFRTLKDRLVSLGVVPHGREHRATGGISRLLTAEEEDDDELLWATCFAERATMGPSVHYFSNVLLPIVQENTKPPWRDHRGNLVPSIESATIRHAVLAVGKPSTASIVCPRDGLMGCAYVDTLTERDHVGSANALLSYTWGYKIRSVSSALTRWVSSCNREVKRTYVWICALCLNQHRIHDNMTSEQLANEFRPRVLTIGRILPMLEPWHSAIYLTRAW